MTSRSDSESDIEMRTMPSTKGKKKIPRSPTMESLKEPKRITTREMINDALEELKSRKGVSYQAIKKHLVEKYQVDTEKMNFYIKKYLKTAVESGAIIQTKGIGATGSFKLAAVKKKTEKTVEKPKKKKETSTKTDKVEKNKDKDKIKVGKTKIEKKSITKDKTDGTKTKKVKINKEAIEKETKRGKKPKQDSKTVLTSKTKTAKKKTISMTRKSIGSIIKAPKMKPKAK